MRTALSGCSVSCRTRGRQVFSQQGRMKRTILSHGRRPSVCWIWSPGSRTVFRRRCQMADRADNSLWLGGAAYRPSAKLPRRWPETGRRTLECRLTTGSIRLFDSLLSRAVNVFALPGNRIRLCGSRDLADWGSWLYKMAQKQPYYRALWVLLYITLFHRQKTVAKKRNKKYVQYSHNKFNI